MQPVRQAAGHEGALEDESRDIFVKRALPKEIAFYQHVQAGVSRIPEGLDDEAYEQHPDAPTADLAGVIPVFMGTLMEHDAAGTGDESSLSYEDIKQRLNKNGQGIELVTESSAQHSLLASLSKPENHNVGQGQESPLHPSNASIVLENLTKGFIKPSVVDIKLGAILWDDEATPEKQERMKKVSETTTSGSLHMRVAGMQIYAGKEATKVTADPERGITPSDSGYIEYGKKYGRSLTDADISACLNKNMFPVSHLGYDRASALISVIIQELLYIRRVFRRIEMRMHSASVLIIYESDLQAFDDRLNNQGEEGVGPLYQAKIVDFAHTSLTPGNGPDLDSIEGLSNLITIMKGWEM
ncbi:Inositol polyphosphate multikinase [Yarrowia sp. B02]|nr:Inositol polyphosphate multikinase [Yarrowia sp. B02]